MKIFDAHCDTIYELRNKNLDLRKNDIHLDINRMSQLDTYIQVFAAYIDKKNIRVSPMKECISLIEKYRLEINKNKDLISPIEKRRDLARAKGGGCHSILSIEGGEALEGNLEAVKMYYDLGVRLITLTWNYTNEIADGIGEIRGGGLTEFGRKAVCLMEKLGIIIDVSHLSERGFWDVAECTDKPFVASHSCVRKLCGHPRNLTDKQLDEIIARNGCVGVNFYPDFLSDTEGADISDIIKHIDYIIIRGGENNVGLGSDFDGVSYLPSNLRGAADMSKLISSMREYGLTDEVIQKVAFDNFYRVFLESMRD